MTAGRPTAATGGFPYFTAARRQHKSRSCTTCGGPISYNSTTGRCRACYVAPLIRTCADCGTRIAPGGKGRCRPCYMAVARLPVPADFAERAVKTSAKDLARHYGCSENTITRWAKDSGLRLGSRHLGARRPVPEGFADIAGSTPLTRLREMFRTDGATVKRWLAEAGIAQFRPKPKQRVSRFASIPRTAPISIKRAGASFNTLSRDCSTEGQAADVLRKYAPVYRCTERGGVPEDRKLLTHWRYGTAILTGAELIERARAKGFNPEAWREIGTAMAERAAA